MSSNSPTFVHLMPFTYSESAAKCLMLNTLRMFFDAILSSHVTNGPTPNPQCTMVVDIETIRISAS